MLVRSFLISFSCRVISFCHTCLWTAIKMKGTSFLTLTGLISSQRMFPSLLISHYSKRETINIIFLFIFREDVKVSIIRWSNTAMEYLLHSCISNSLPTLLECFSTYCNDSSPIDIRIEVAKMLGEKWTVLHNIQSSSILYWRMVFRLLHDVEAAVRSAMILTVQQNIIKSNIINIISESAKILLFLGDGDSSKLTMCQQLCIKSLIDFIATLYNPLNSFSLLLSLSSLDFDSSPSPDSTIPTTGTVSSLLFEEDQSNSYIEPVQLLMHISAALKSLLETFDVETRSLAENKLKEVIADVNPVDGLDARELWLDDLAPLNNYYSYILSCVNKTPQ